MRVNNSHTRPSETDETAITPSSSFENDTPPRWTVAVENGPANCFAAPPQIQVVSPLIAINSPTVRSTTASNGLPCNGRISTCWTATPPPNERINVATNAGQNDQPWSSSDQQTNADSVAISPCAKLSTPVAR